MSRKWFNLEAQTDDAIFGGNQSAYSSLGLTRTQRIGGFAACFVGGLGISLLGAILLFLGATGAFASFLIGFKTQLEKMFKPVRVVATILLFASIAMTFVSAFVLPAILCIVFVIVQYLAYLWYVLVALLACPNFT
ncbi:vesicle transporter SFT2B [Kwoniella heveanensis CBS 569]|nr:vesicle transporter SFT2B [Kwoniella heveanensis CBS 569]